MILASYLILVFLGFLFCYFSKKNIFYFILIFLLLCFFSYQIRNFEFENDIITYAQVMTYDWSSYFQFYYIKEPIYWFFSKSLFSILKSESLVFFIIDSISFAFILFYFWKNKVNLYFVIIFFTFFVSVMGLLNVYRQYLSTVFIFISLYCFNSNCFSDFIRKNLYIIIAVFIHNVALLFYPLVLVYKNKYKASLVSIVFVYMVIYFFSDTKSSSDTGEVNPILYLFLIILVLLLYIGLSKFRINRIKDFKNYYFIFYFLLTFSYTSFFLGGAQLKRIGMINLILALFIVYELVERKFFSYNLIFVRLLFLVLAVIPCFIFSSVRDMLI